MEAGKPSIDVSDSPSPHSFGNKIARVLWGMVWLFLFRPSPKVLHGWRRLLLRLFGARIGRGAHIHASVKVWGPWNLIMEDHSCLGPYVDCYCVDTIRLGPHSTVSQYGYLCGASHDHEHPNMPLVTAPITIGREVWVAADVFVAPGVTIGDGALVGARSSVFRNVDPWTVVAGNPAKFIKPRIVKPA